VPVIGWSQELDRRLPYDPEKATALLAEAGYPEGFDVRFDCWAPRERICRTIGASLQEIGIRVGIALLPTPELGQKIQTRATDFFWWGHTEAFDSFWMFKDRYRSDAEFAGTGYADPEVDALIDQIEGEMVTYVRDTLIEKVWRKVLGDVYVPLYRPINAWALRADLELPIAIFNGRPEFRDARYTTPPAHDRAREGRYGARAGQWVSGKSAWGHDQSFEALPWLVRSGVYSSRNA
jgi:peptide/nickel transport system substrate-binding protein